MAKVLGWGLYYLLHSYLGYRFPSSALDIMQTKDYSL
jgi:hypothetical protein